MSEQSGPKPSRLGIMGGSFDPIHYGHLVAAEGARVDFELDKVLFVPAGHSPHKQGQAVTATKHRYLMTVLATLTNPAFEVSRVDVDRPGLSYTVETLRLLRQHYGEETELFFITGADVIRELLTWKDPEDLLTSCSLIAATRPGYPLNRLQQELGDLYDKYQERIFVLSVPALAISSTDIRRRVGHQHSIRYLVPETVAHYIQKNDLYNASESAEA